MLLGSEVGGGVRAIGAGEENVVNRDDSRGVR